MEWIRFITNTKEVQDECMAGIKYVKNGGWDKAKECFLKNLDW